MLIIIPSTKEADGVFVNNGRFRIKHCHPSVIMDRQGRPRPWLYDSISLDMRPPEATFGEIQFKQYTRDDGGITPNWRRTAFGWNFAHDGVLLDENVVNFSYALRRHIAERKPEYQCGYDGYLRNNQRKAIARYHDAIVEVMAKELDGELFHENLEESARYLATMPHPKRELRENDVNKRDMDGSGARKCWTKMAQWKFKTVEWAKPGKAGRIIVDLGVGASLQGARFAEWAKHKLGDKHIPMQNAVFWFITAPDPELIDEAFEALISGRYETLFVVFSDDCCCRINGKFMNLDISSCDMSHESELFDLLFDCFPCNSEVREALEAQMTADIKIINPSIKHNCSGHYKRAKINELLPEDYVILTPMERMINGKMQKIKYLQSGSTVTTLVNVLAWLLIFFVCVTENLDPVDAAIEAGYIVTKDECNIPEELQFLKMSPVLDINNKYRAVRNLGVVLRASGVCKGDLPGRGCIKKRATDFQSQLMNGLLADIECPELWQLNPRTSTKKLDPRNLDGAGAYTVYRKNKVTVTLDNILRRYHLEEDEVEEFRYILKNIGLFQSSHSPGASKIMNLDYGLKTPAQQPRTYISA